MNELIEKMKADKMKTAKFEAWYENMMENIQKCSYMQENGQTYTKTDAYRHANIYLDLIHGFIDALEAVGYITTNERNVYFEQVIEQFEF